jgi:Tol biopolymer transport system component
MSYTTIGGCIYDGGWLPALSGQQFAGRSIVYQNWNGCDLPFDNLYSVAGTTIQRLTNDQAQETQPVVSPDGTAIAYVWADARGFSCRGCSEGIRIATANGAPMRTLTNPDECLFDDSPTWSPDGMTILYGETGCDNPGELFTVPASGGTPTDLGLAGINPAWGPSKIAYQGNLDTSGGIWTADPDGSNPTKVASRGSRPAWSPTGTLAYLVGASAVVVGGTRVQLPFASVGSLAWSPGGTRLVVVARETKNGLADIYTVKTDGTNPVRLTKYYDPSAWG